MELIIENCFKYNSQPAIIKKGEQFEFCIKTEWGNFKKEIHRKGISYDGPLIINEKILERLIMVEEKKTRKKVPSQVSFLEIQPKPPQNTILPPISEIVNMEDKAENRFEYPAAYIFRAQDYVNISLSDKREKLHATIGDYEDI